jgi:hypothetical protein
MQSFCRCVCQMHAASRIRFCGDWVPEEPERPNGKDELLNSAVMVLQPMLKFRELVCAQRLAHADECPNDENQQATFKARFAVCCPVGL